MDDVASSLEVSVAKRARLGFNGRRDLNGEDLYLPNEGGSKMSTLLLVRERNPWLDWIGKARAETGVDGDEANRSWVAATTGMTLLRQELLVLILLGERG